MIASRNLLTWPPSLIQLTELSQLNNSSWFLQKNNFLERQISVVLSFDPSRDFFRSYWASPLINLIELLVLGRPIYIYLITIYIIIANAPIIIIPIRKAGITEVGKLMVDIRR